MARLNAHDLEKIMIATLLLPVAAMMIVISFWVRDKLAAKWFLLSMVGIYYLILFGVYLSTPKDLDYHLITSAHRVMYPIVLTLFVFCIWFWEAKYLARGRSGEPASGNANAEACTAERLH